MQAKYEYGDYSLVESFKNMRTNLSINKDIKTIVVTSSEMNGGKTTTVSNLAKCFSDLENKKTLLIDCDLRKPSVHRHFNLENKKGLTDIIYGEENLSECLQYNDKLHILTCGRRPKNPAEMLESDVMINFIEAMKQRYDYIFIDSPPVSRVNDACIISKCVDGTIIISASNEVDIDLAKLSKKRLEKVNANIIGVILNKFKESDDKFYHYYGYGDEDIENSKKSFLKKLFKKKR